jgi:septal ring-binding cell division protein DamX
VALKAPVPAANAIRTPPTSKNAVAARRSHPAAETASDEDLSTGAAVAPPSEPAPASAESAGTDEDEPDTAPAVAPRRRLAAVTPPAPRAASGPYSVQIDAVMDLHGAQEMARKIKAKGFQPYVVRTDVDGKTWYRLRVGHYATPEDAQAAESRLHQEFNQNPAGN